MSKKVMLKKDFKVFCGIDFGTQGFGLAYAFRDPNTQDESKENDIDKYKYNLILHTGWDDVAQELLKLNSCIAIKPSDSCGNNTESKDDVKASMNTNAETYFGNTARITASYNGNNKGYTLIENYKMYLYTGSNKEIAKTIKSINTDTVFINSIKYLKDEALQFLNKKKILKRLGYNVGGKKDHEMLLTVDDVQWILTVPAIWDDRAKQKMREWGIQAGLLRKHYANHLKIVLEPECASLQTQHEFKDEFKNGDNYIVIDAGGGTVDIVCHQVFGTFGAKELFLSEGGPFGSTNIDKKLIELFTIIFDDVCGSGTMNKFRENKAKKWIKLFEKILESKRSFYNYGCEDTSIGLTEYFSDFIIEELCERYYDAHSTDLNDSDAYQMIENKINNMDNIFNVSVDNNNEKLVELSKMGEYTILIINHKIWEYIFDSCCMNGIIDVVNKQLQKMKKEGMECHYIFTVGGLSRNKYFQKRINDEYANNNKYGTIKIKSTKEPLLSVVFGAARYGILGNFVMQRILSKTYCVEVNDPIETVKFENESKRIIKYLSNKANKKDKNIEKLITKHINDLKNNTKFKQFYDENSNDKTKILQELIKILKSKLKRPNSRIVPNEYIENKDNQFKHGNKIYIKGLLKILAIKGQKIIVNSSDKNDKIIHNVYRLSKKHKKVLLPLYETDNNDAVVISDAKLVGTFNIDCKEFNDNELGLDIDIRFDDTLLIAHVYPKGKMSSKFMIEAPITYKAKQH